MSGALVVFSGGQDSTTCLAIAKANHTAVQAIAFDYGQRHRIELDQARYLADYTQTALKIVDLSFMSSLTQNALTDSTADIAHPDGQLPTTFVPGRNQLFLSVAASWAYQLNILHLYTGVCEADYSGYPDCRYNFIQSLEHSIQLGMEYAIQIHTPLMNKTKAESIQIMQQLGCLDWYAHTHTCYHGHRPPCGTCPACQLRAAGFAEAGVEDPLG